MKTDAADADVSADRLALSVHIHTRLEHGRCHERLSTPNHRKLLCTLLLINSVPNGVSMEFVVEVGHECGCPTTHPGKACKAGELARSASVRIRRTPTKLT